MLRWSTASRPGPWWGAYVAPAAVLILTLGLISLGHALGWGTALAGLFLASPARLVQTPTVATTEGLPATSDLEIERDRLLLEISQLRELLVALEQAQAGVANILLPPEEATLKSANVILRDPTLVYPAFIIDLGARDGVKVGQPVMGQLSVIGRISKVWPDRARVDMLTSTGVSYGAVVQSSRALGVVASNGGELELQYVAKGTVVPSGDPVVTAGVPGPTPAGLPIGTVGTVSEEAESLTLRIKVQPLENPWTLTVVRVVQLPGEEIPVDDLAPERSQES